VQDRYCCLLLTDFGACESGLLLHAAECFGMCAKQLLLSAADCFGVCARQLMLSVAEYFRCVCKRVTAFCC